MTETAVDLTRRTGTGISVCRLHAEQATWTLSLSHIALSVTVLVNVFFGHKNEENPEIEHEIGIRAVHFGRCIHGAFCPCLLAPSAL